MSNVTFVQGRKWRKAQNSTRLTPLSAQGVEMICIGHKTLVLVRHIHTQVQHLLQSTHLNIRKIAIGMSKTCQKLTIFFKKIAKIFFFFQNNYQWQFSGGSAPQGDSLSGLVQPQNGTDWPKMGQIGPKWDNPGLKKSQICPIWDQSDSIYQTKMY